MKGMYGLKQVGIIANMELTKHLEKIGYHPVQHTPGLCKHNTQATIFTLVVDDFAIKYTLKQYDDHLLQALCDKYTISTDWGASLYIGITLDWKYTTGNVNLSMPKYVARALHKLKQALQTFHHNNKPEYSPHSHVEPKYGQKVQYAEPTNDAPPLDSVDISLIQNIVGKFLYYGIAVDNTILFNPNTMEEVPQLPNNGLIHHIYMTIADLDGKLNSDQTGRFPITSNRGNCYVGFLWCWR